MPNGRKSGVSVSYKVACFDIERLCSAVRHPGMQVKAAQSSINGDELAFLQYRGRNAMPTAKVRTWIP